MTAVELSDEQRQALLNEQGKPLDVVDPLTQRHYVLLAWDQYERVRSALEQHAKAANPCDIPEGILRSQQAFWRDLPQLLQARRNHGQWVCYHGNERIGIGGTERELIRECVRRGLREDAYYTDIIEPRSQAPWEIEEIEPGGHGVDDISQFDEPGKVGEPL